MEIAGKLRKAVIAAALGLCAAAPLLAATHHAAKAKSHAKAAAPTHTKAKSGHGHAAPAVKATHSAAVRGRRGAKAVRVSRTTRFSERFSASSFAPNVDALTQGDITAGEDPVVRAAAIQALGNMNGTAVAIDPNTGRILAMVNQKLALSSGAEPCSTIKLTVALAALEEGLIKRDTPVNLGGGYKVNLTYALAKSVNPFFEVLGRAMGFDRVKHYANEFGLGELAGYGIEGEQLGVYPDEELPAKLGGVGRMCSFGESISMTPLQLGAIVSAIANGGTLYYLQHPTTPDEVAAFNPKVKRILDIAPVIPEMLPGMAGAVEAPFGTARSLRVNFREFPVMGKTGTCSNNGTRFGWFGSYAETPAGRIVTVFFLEGGRPTFGPKAAELTGQFYRALYDSHYFLPKSQTADTAAITGTR
jgi:cell division protein FtsI/penicillin-binding protein 2